MSDYNNNYRGLPSNAHKPNSSLWNRGREGIEGREGERKGGKRREGGGRD